jgi:hypothetical protein
MTERDKICLECPLPDCREADPGCLRKPHPEKGGEEKIHLPGPLDIKETAGRMRCSADWLRKEIRKFKQGLPASVPRFFMVGNRYRWDPPDVEAWLASKKQGGAA